MNIIKSSLSGLVLVLIGELVGANLVFAQEANHDFGIVQLNDSPTAAATGAANPGGSGSAVTSNVGESNSVSINGVDVPLSPDVVQAIASFQEGASGANTSGSETGGSITSESISRRSSGGDSGSSDSGGRDSISEGFRDSESSDSISINDLAKLIETDLQESVNTLVAAESIERQPRKFTRRRNSDQNCNCVIGSDGERKTLAELQAEVDQKTTQAENFVREINKLDPKNSIW